MDFQIFHNYNKLVRRGLAKPLECPSCEHELTLMKNDQDEPILKCYWCGSLTEPGLNTYDMIRAVVKEFLI